MGQPVLYTDSSGNVVRVKRGFSWPAFFIGPLWALYRQLWVVFLLLTTGMFALRVLFVYASRTRNATLMIAVVLLEVAVMVICGVYGNRWVVSRLKRKGYVPKAVRILERPERTQPFLAPFKFSLSTLFLLVALLARTPMLLHLHLPGAWFLTYFFLPPLVALLALAYLIGFRRLQYLIEFLLSLGLIVTLKVPG